MPRPALVTVPFVSPRRHPPAVYWRRRALALIALLVVVALIVIGFNALFGRDDTAPTAAPSPTATPTSTSPATASASASPSGTASATGSASASASPTVAACTAEQISVRATMDKDAYAATERAQVGMIITNTGSGPCTMDVGSGPLSLTITSGSDRIWSSDDCLPAGVANRMALVQPGESGRLQSQVAWNLDRSRPGCPGGTPTASATRTAVLNAGNYRLIATAGDFTSPPKAFQIR